MFLSYHHYFVMPATVNTLLLRCDDAEQQIKGGINAVDALIIVLVVLILLVVTGHLKL